MTSPRNSEPKPRASGGFSLSASGMPGRLLLQRRGPQSLRRHTLRALSRVMLLVTADVVTFLGFRAIVRLLRDQAVYGESVAAMMRAVFPRGILGGTKFGGLEFVFALIAGLVVVGAYGRGDRRRDIMRVAEAVTLAVSLSLWHLLWAGNAGLIVGQGMLMIAVVWCALSLERLTVDAFIKFVFQTPADGDPMVFVGDREDEEARRIHDRVLGPNRMRNTKWVHLPRRGETHGVTPEKAIERVHDALSTENADTLVLCGEYDSVLFEAIVESSEAAGIRVLAVPRVSGVMQERPGMVWYGGTPFVELTVPGLRGWQLVAKRVIDFLGSFIGLILLSPLFAVIAAAIKLDSPGPVFFRQERVGYAGRIFRVFKFRTMSADADSQKASLSHLNHTGDSRLFKIPQDPRVTPLGRFLRKWSVDELPQLVNVLSGEMSLVGPRPFFESDLKGYLDHHFARLGAKPGITGLWQITGRSEVTDFEEVVRLDREYIDRWTVFLDFWILLMTVPAVLRGRGAY